MGINPIAWTPREMNEEADWVSNLSMDFRQSMAWTVSSRVPELLKLPFIHFGVWTDGGRRTDGCGSTSFVIRACYISQTSSLESFLVAIRGEFFSEPPPILELERAAIEMAQETMAELALEDTVPHHASKLIETFLGNEPSYSRRVCENLLELQ